jgi:hypothetical protein
MDSFEQAEAQMYELGKSNAEDFMANAALYFAMHAYGVDAAKAQMRAAAPRIRAELAKHFEDMSLLDFAMQGFTDRLNAFFVEFDAGLVPPDGLTE